jgi:hypothetical protein
LGSLDVALCAALFLGTVWYLLSWPRDLYRFDEGLFLYGAVRILHGDVMYRDFFEIITPASLYGMAVMFALFGVTMETARATMGVVHGLIAVLVYVGCYLVSRRRTLGTVAGSTHVAYCYPALSLASPHWFTTLELMVLAVVLLRWRTLSVARAVLVGALCGLIILTQQQKGVIIALAPLVLIVLRAALDRRAGLPASHPAWVAVVGYLGGVAAIVVPVMLTFIVLAGPLPVIDALVLFPMRAYPAVHKQMSWGSVHLGRGITLRFGFAFFLVTLIPQVRAYVFPLLMVVGGARITHHAWRRVSAPHRLLAPTVLSIAAALAILYNPNYTHLTTVAPVWFVLGAEALGVMLGRIPARTPRRLLGAVLIVVAVVPIVSALRANLIAGRQRYPVSHETPFGRIDFGSQWEVDFTEAARRVISESGARELFAFPCSASMYLFTETVNPTRYQILIPRYSTRAQVEEVVAVLERRRVPFVVKNLYWHLTELEPLMSYLRKHYTPVPMPPSTGAPTIFLLQRRFERVQF